jgi:hypothetical protein
MYSDAIVAKIPESCRLALAGCATDVTVVQLSELVNVL